MMQELEQHNRHLRAHRLFAARFNRYYSKKLLFTDVVNKTGSKQTTLESNRDATFI